MSWIQRLGPAPDTTRFALFSAALLIAAVFVQAVDFVPVIDHANLAFHEAGHLVFGLLGEWMHWLGGTLAQFVFPIATTVHFLRRQQLLSAACCAIWGFENLRYTAVYLADARSQLLPLVGGGEHDWAWMLGRLGWLEHDQRIAGLLVFACWSGWLAVWCIVAWRWHQGRRSAATEAAAAERQRIIERARLDQQARDRRTADG